MPHGAPWCPTVSHSGPLPLFQSCRCSRTTVHLPAMRVPVPGGYDLQILLGFDLSVWCYLLAVYRVNRTINPYMFQTKTSITVYDFHSDNHSILGAGPVLLFMFAAGCTLLVVLQACRIQFKSAKTTLQIWQQRVWRVPLKPKVETCFNKYGLRYTEIDL